MSDNGIGAQVVDPYRGWLVFESLPDNLQRAEDGTQELDFRRRRWEMPDGRDQSGDWYWTRDATPTEITLLQHLNYTVPAEGDDGYPLQTVVYWRTETLRQRRWPVLETTTTEGN